MGWRNGSDRRTFVQVVVPLDRISAKREVRPGVWTNRPSPSMTRADAVGATLRFQFAANPLLGLAHGSAFSCDTHVSPIRPINVASAPQVGGLVAFVRVCQRPRQATDEPRPGPDVPGWRLANRLVPGGRHRRPCHPASGEGGIRTPERGQPPLRDFQSRPFNRSGTSPLGAAAIAPEPGSAPGRARSDLPDAVAEQRQPRRRRASMPVTATSLDPIMKSMWSSLRLMCGRSGSSSTVKSSPSPSAMWLAAFSSSSVSKNTVSRLPIRLSRSTSATSPSRAAPASRLRQRPQRVRALIGVDLDRLPVLEPDPKPRDQHAGDEQRLRRATRGRGPERGRGW